MTISTKTFYRVDEIAKQNGVKESTVRQWLKTTDFIPADIRGKAIYLDNDGVLSPIAARVTGDYYTQDVADAYAQRKKPQQGPRKRVMVNGVGDECGVYSSIKDFCKTFDINYYKYKHAMQAGYINFSGVKYKINECN